VSANGWAREGAQAINVKAFPIINVLAALQSRMFLVGWRAAHGACNTKGALAMQDPLGKGVELRAMGICRIHGESNFEHAVAIGVSVGAMDQVPQVKVAQKARSE
jgi:hypothetical protein